MPYYTALQAKWPSLSADTTENKLVALNNLTAPRPAPAPIASVMTYLRSNGLWLGIKAASVGAVPSLGAQAAVDLNADLRMETIDFGLPIVQAMLADLVTHGLLTQEQAAALNALGTEVIPWWQSAGYPRPFDMGDITEAGLE